jgi:hypothetical protein
MCHGTTFRETGINYTIYFNREGYSGRDIPASKKIKGSYVGTALVLEGETSIFHARCLQRVHSHAGSETLYAITPCIHLLLLASIPA